jgi:protein-L-isoaspartate(D-aspartate) O-methyltransferase
MSTQGRPPAEADREAELAIIRRTYAKHVLANAEVDDARVEAAFAAVRREDFLGPGPWPMLRWPSRYVPTPSDDPIYLYQDALVGIIPKRNLNNGQPWLHALLIAAAAPRLGEHVVHIGAGVGYYTAILAHIVGEIGRVTAIEFDGGLIERLAANFAGQPNVRALQGDGAQIELDPADVIYVNAGATRPADIWLDRLEDGGRLILPLTSDKGFGENPENIPIQRRGAVFRIERRGNEFLAKWISAVAIFPCEGARDAECERALAAAFEKGGWDRVTRLYRHGDVREERCWLKGPDWCLAYD